MLGPEDVAVNSNPQPPGSFPHATRVAAHGKQAAPFSRLLRHARGAEDVFYPDVPTGNHYKIVLQLSSVWIIAMLTHFQLVFSWFGSRRIFT